MKEGRRMFCRPILFKSSVIASPLARLGRSNLIRHKWLYNYPKMVAVKVPTIDKRKRIPQKAINQVVKQIVEKFKPQKIILFGSYARGNPRPESDVDMLVVMNTRL